MGLFSTIPKQIKEVPIVCSFSNIDIFPEFSIEEKETLIPLLFHAAICDYKFTNRGNNNESYYYELQFINFVIKLLNCTVAQGNAFIYLHNFHKLSFRLSRFERSKTNLMLFLIYCLLVVDGAVNYLETDFLFQLLKLCNITVEEFAQDVKNYEAILNETSENRNMQR